MSNSNAIRVAHDQFVFSTITPQGSCPLAARLRTFYNPIRLISRYPAHTSLVASIDDTVPHQFYAMTLISCFASFNKAIFYQTFFITEQKLFQKYERFPQYWLLRPPHAPPG